jgi:hypothetical protein
MAQFSTDGSGNYFGEHGQQLHKDFWGNLHNGSQHVGKLDYWGNVETQGFFGAETHRVTYQSPSTPPRATAEPAPTPTGPLMSRDQVLALLHAPLTDDQLALISKWEAGQKRRQKQKFWSVVLLVILLVGYFLV